MNWPICLHCRRLVKPNGHNPDTCKPWLARERDWKIWKGLV